MIYIFTNKDFGRDFLSIVRSLRERFSTPAITVVMSGKRGWPKPLIPHLKRRLTWPIVKWRNARQLKREIGVEVIVSDDINASMPTRIRSDDDGFVAGFNQIFKPELISRFRTLVNCHPSLLPFYRGPVPSFWCIKNGEQATGYTFHRITNALDKGEILWQEIVEIHDGDTPEMLNARIGSRAAPAFERYLLSLLGAGSFIQERIDAAAVYKNHVDYKSFPPE